MEVFHVRLDIEAERTEYSHYCLTLGTVHDLRVVTMKDGVIGSPLHAIRPHIAQVIDQSDRNTSLSRVINMYIKPLLHLSAIGQRTKRKYKIINIYIYINTNTNVCMHACMLAFESKNSVVHLQYPEQTMRLLL